MKRSLPRRTRDPFWDLVAIARRLHGPGGCPWDRAQTIRSLLPHLIEETWEVFESVRNRRQDALEEELGDVLYTVLFLTLLAERRGQANLRRLLVRTREKMIRRHPHVFDGIPVHRPQDAYAQWQTAKRAEGRRLGHSKAPRALLVASWDFLRTQPRAAHRMKRLLGASLPRRSKTGGRRRREGARS